MGGQQAFTDQQRRAALPFRCTWMTLDLSRKPGTGLKFSLEGLQTLDSRFQRAACAPPSSPWSCLISTGLTASTGQLPGVIVPEEINAASF